METAHLLPFMAVGLAAVMVPGPDFAIVTGTSLKHGRRAGVGAAIGIAAGICVWGLITALGLAAVVATSAVAFTVVKVVGGLYLMYLGVRAVMSARSMRNNPSTQPFDPLHDDVKGGARTGFTQGLMTNLLNPKVALFFLTLMPQFLGDNPTFADIALLALVQAVIALAWFSLYASAVAVVRPVLQRRRAQMAIEATTGALFLAVGLRLVLTRS